MDRARDLEGRDVHVPNSVHVQIEGQSVATDHQGDDRAADAPGEASLTNAQHRAAKHEGHADTVDDTQSEVVDRREPQVRQGRSDLGSSRIEFGHTRVRGHQRVDDENNDRDDDHRGEDADDLHDPIKIQECSEDHEARAHRAPRPRGQSELLFEVRARAREHHEAHREARKNEHHIDDAAHDGVSDAFEHVIVVARAKVGTQLQGDDTEDDVEDSQCGDSNQAGSTKRQEVLEQILAAGQASADDDSHIRKGNRDILF